MLRLSWELTGANPSAALYDFTNGAVIYFIFPARRKTNIRPGLLLFNSSYSLTFVIIYMRACDSYLLN